MEQQALDLIVKNLSTALGEGYKLVQPGEAGNNKPAILKGELSAYAVIFDKKDKKFILQSAEVDEGELSEWKNMSVWIFDSENGSDMKDATSISNDFCDTVIPAVAKKKIAKAPKAKKEKGEDKTVNPLFLVNRFVNIFPDVRYAMQAQKAQYGDIVAVEMFEKIILPRIKELLNSDMNAKIEKVCDVLSNGYRMGDLDVRTIITYIILANITDEKHVAKIEDVISEDLLKAWECTNKYKHKKFKAEKVKKVEKLLAEKSTGSLA